MSKVTYDLDANGNAIWTTKYQFRGAFDATQAAEWATDAAALDFPPSIIEIVNVTRTSSRRHTVTVRGTVSVH